MTFLKSGKNNPCPVCGRTHDSDCRWWPSQDLVLCHKNFAHEKSLQAGQFDVIEKYGYLGPTKDSRCGKYYINSVSKPKRTSKTNLHIYTDRNGNYLVAVKVIEVQGRAKKDIIQGYYDPSSRVAEDGFVFASGWKKAHPEIVSQIPIYNYQAVQQAIAANLPVFWVEGEKCVEAMRSVGLVATTSIGGSEALDQYGNYENDLNGARLIIVPDADEAGVKYANKVEQKFFSKVHSIKYLYPFPYSKDWSSLPQKGGFDVADWIYAGATSDLIQGQIQGFKRNVETEKMLRNVEALYAEISTDLRAVENVDEDGAKFLALHVLAQKYKNRGLNLTPQNLKTLQGYQPTGSAFQVESAYDYIQSVNTQVKWLVKGLIPQGFTTVFYGESGSGKSLFMYYLVTCVLTGKALFNRFEISNPGKVLIVQLEEGRGPIPGERLLRDEFHVKDERLKLIDFAWVAKPADIPAMLERVRDEGYVLVCIDSLTAMNQELGISENNTEYAAPLQKLTTAVASMETTFVIIHHSNKGSMRDDESVAAARGTSAIIGNVMQAIQYRKREEFRTFKVTKSRASVDFQKITLFPDFEKNRFNILELEGEQVRPGKVEERQEKINQVEKLLRENAGVVYTQEEIVEELNMSRRTVGQVLNQLVDEDIVVCNKSQKPYRYWVESFEWTTKNNLSALEDLATVLRGENEG